MLVSFAFGGVLNQIQGEQEVVIEYASRSLRLSQRRYSSTRREMLAAITMCTHFRSYLRGAQFTLRTYHQSLQWLQKFRTSDGMLTRWYMLLGQLSVTFEYRPGSQHANADGLSRQCAQCLCPDCPVGLPDLAVVETCSTSDLTDLPFAESAMDDSMDAYLLLEMSGETWVAAVHLDEATGDLTPPNSDPDLIALSLADKILMVVRDWVRAGIPPTWSECAGLSPELRSWPLQFSHLSLDLAGRLWHRRAPPTTSLQLVVLLSSSLLDRVYWPGLREDVRLYIVHETLWCTDFPRKLRVR